MTNVHYSNRKLMLNCSLHVSLPFWVNQASTSPWALTVSIASCLHGQTHSHEYSHNQLHSQVQFPSPRPTGNRILTCDSVIGAANALFTLGAAVGAILQGFVADWYGRKKGMALAAVLATIGGALSAGSVNIAMIIVVRIIQGIGAGMVVCRNYTRISAMDRHTDSALLDLSRPSLPG